MKKEIIPTAPSERAKRTEQRAARNHNAFWIMVIAIVVSSFIGFISAIVGRNYPPDWPFAEQLLITSVDSPEIVFVDSQDNSDSAKLIEVIQAKQSKTIVSIFASSTVQYKEANELAKGIILSTDGWIAVPAEAIGNVLSVSVVTHDARVFVSDQIEIDPYSGVAFIKIDATQLPVADFKTAPVTLAEPILLYTTSVTSGDRVAKGIIENTAFSSDNEFSASANNLVYLTDNVSREAYYGSPVFDSTGLLVGMNLLDHQILPISVLATKLFDIFSEEQIEHHSWDFSYQPLYRTIDPDIGVRKRGVKVISISTGTTGLLPGDIILEMNGKSLNADSDDLATILANTPLGSTIEFALTRNGKRKKIEAILE